MIGGPCSACGGTGIWGGVAVPSKDAKRCAYVRKSDGSCGLPLEHPDHDKYSSRFKHHFFDPLPTDGVDMPPPLEPSEKEWKDGYFTDVVNCLGWLNERVAWLRFHYRKKLGELERDRDEVQGNAEAEVEPLRYRLAVAEQKLERVREIARRPYKGAINSSELLRALDLEPKPRVDQAMPENAP